MCNFLGSMSLLSNIYKVRSCANPALNPTASANTRNSATTFPQFKDLSSIQGCDQRPQRDSIGNPKVRAPRSIYPSALVVVNQRLKSVWTPRFSAIPSIKVFILVLHQSLLERQSSQDFSSDLFLSFLFCKHEALPFLLPRRCYFNPSTTPRRRPKICLCPRSSG